MDNITPELLQQLSKSQFMRITDKVFAQARHRGSVDFDWFTFNIFSASFNGKFVGGQYIHDVCKHLQLNPYTLDVSGRDHFKSTRLADWLMYMLLNRRDTGFEAWYFSYSHSMAAYHLAKLKGFIESNPFFVGIQDLKPRAESVLSYSWDGKHVMTIRPAGLLGFTRGIHAEIVVVDDPFQSEDNSKIEPVKIAHINDVMRGAIMPMVKKGGFLRIASTPQTPGDFIFDEAFQTRFAVWITGVILNEAKKEVLWPEWKSYDELDKIRTSIGPTLFQKEYQVQPASAANSYLDKNALLKCIDPNSKNWAIHVHPELDDDVVVAGFDIGKKRHPSHLSVFIKRSLGENSEGIELFTYEQILSVWLDHWEYSKQVEFINNICDYFNISKLVYDNTRSEFEGFKERGELHDAMEPVVFNMRKQSAMAAYLGTLVESERISFVNDDRQYNQNLAVTGDLQSIESLGPNGGHADSYWSTCAAVYEAYESKLRIRSLYN